MTSWFICSCAAISAHYRRHSNDDDFGSRCSCSMWLHALFRHTDSQEWSFGRRIQQVYRYVLLVAVIFVGVVVLLLLWRWHVCMTYLLFAMVIAFSSFLSSTVARYHTHTRAHKHSNRTSDRESLSVFASLPSPRAFHHGERQRWRQEEEGPEVPTGRDADDEQSQEAGQPRRACEETRRRGKETHGRSQQEGEGRGQSQGCSQ